jgi:hypothetical protein
VVRHVEEVRAAQVFVALGLARPQRRRIDAHLGPAVLGTVGVELERPLQVLEGATDVRDHHVPHAEFRGGVGFVEGPSRHHRASFLR